MRFGGSRQTLSDIQNRADESGGGIRQPDDLLVDLGVDGDGASSVAIGIADADYLLDLELSALAAEGHAEIVARPKVVTANKRVATIESGVEIPFQQATNVRGDFHCLQGRRTAVGGDTADHRPDERNRQWT